MSDTIGRISVPSPVSSGLTFPFISDFGYGMVRPWKVTVHRFGELATKAEQRFLVGMGPRKFPFKRAMLSFSDKATLWDFFESVQGGFQTFTYNAPMPDQSTSAYTVVFENTPLSISELVNACSTGFNFVECIDPNSAPTLNVSATCLRFPSSAMQTAMLGQNQQIIPLLHIRVREAAVPDIYLSDRRVTLADSTGGAVRAAMGWAGTSQLYLPRVLDIGDKTDVLISQSIDGTADNVQMVLGNADRIMTQLANDTDLMYASIDLCLFHVQSQTILQLWKGVIMSFQSDGTARFSVSCSDGIYQMFQQYPTNLVNRTCWKIYNDGVNCPWATASGTVQISGASTAGVPFAGDPTQCDYYFDSANGCEAHNMTKYFGGQPAVPQQANVYDNSTGFLGLDRNLVTATSIVSDTIWGQPLPDIWCNQQDSALYAFYATCQLINVRDDSQNFEGLGILGAGPIGAYTVDSNPTFTGATAFGGEFVTNADGYTYLVAPLLDGYPCYGFSISSNGEYASKNSSQGLRQIIGNDPCDPSTDQFALPNVPNAPVDTAILTYAQYLAAGTAFVWISYTKPSGVSPTEPEQHTMTVPVAQGLTGWTWDQYGSRTAQGGLINPFWIAVNTLLRALGLQNASSAVQLSQIALASLIVGDGSGTAEIANDLVTPILGTGTELQFQFQGMVATPKPLRDWLTEILATGLGFYTWEFGKLKLGCRINASAVDAYTIGNILYQSLVLSPITASFEHLIIDFADVAYQYQANIADYQDKTHAQYYGRANAPLTARQHCVGVSTLSQALRIAAVRTREEEGGVTPTEWKNARRGSWKTTILGLNNEIGQVVSMTHPDIPGYKGTCTVSGLNLYWVSGDQFDDTLVNHNVKVTITGAYETAPASYATVSSPPGDSAQPVPFQVITADFRIKKWTLYKDWSVEVDVQTVTESMYNLLVGPQPTDVAPTPLQVLAWPVPLTVWMPWQVQAAGNDALFPGVWTFDADQSYTATADLGQQASIVAMGKLPVNSLLDVSGPYQQSVVATGTPAIQVLTTGGSIPGGSLLRIAFNAVDSNGLPTPTTNIALVQVPAGTDTNQIVLNNIVWPAVTGLDYAHIFASTQDDDIGLVYSTELTATGSGTTYTPNSITLDGPIQPAWGIPNPNIAKVRLKAKLELHAGDVGVAVTGIATNQIISSELVDTVGSPPIDWTGRVVSVIGRADASTPFASFNVTAFAASTGTLTLDRDPTGIVEVDDAITIRCQDTSLGSTAAAVTTVTDSYLSNVANYTVSGGVTTPAPYTGLPTNALVGNLIRVLANTGQGQLPSKITSNTATSISFQPALTMDETSVWVIEGPGWLWQQDVSVIQNLDPTKPTTITIPTTNYIDQPLLIEGFLVDVNGNESPEGDGPIREEWIYGSAGNIEAAIVSAVEEYAANSEVLALTLTANTTISTPTPAAQGDVLVVLLLQDGTGGRTATWSNPPFRVSQAHPGEKANTYSIFIFTAINDPADAVLKWFLTGAPITNAS
jgi:hypothetical protein